MDIYTIGHSTHDKKTFLFILKSQEIKILVDVRSYAGSKHVPHFNKENMQEWVVENGIQYLHMPELGGRRRKSIDIDESLIAGWTHVSFKNYVAYSLSIENEQGIQKVISIAATDGTCIFCSECLPWKCHRSIISNTLTARGINVWHIMSETKLDKHILA